MIFGAMHDAIEAFVSLHGRAPREIHMSPKLYRAWRKALESLVGSASELARSVPDGDWFCGFPVRCSERISPDNMVLV